MTEAEAKFSLEHIRKSIGSIQLFVGKMNVLEFLMIEKSDEKTYRAVKNCLAEIGESVKRLMDGKSPSLYARPEKYWKKIYGMRCKIVHDFDKLKLKTIWNTIENELEELHAIVSEEIDALDA